MYVGLTNERTNEPTNHPKTGMIAIPSGRGRPNKDIVYGADCKLLIIKFVHKMIKFTLLDVEA